MKNDIVFITSRFPYPLNKGDKLRAYHQIKDLSKFSNVHLISISEKTPSSSDKEALDPYCKSINNFVLSKPKRLVRILKDVFSDRPFSVSYFFNSKVKKKVEEKIKEIEPEVIHCHLIRAAEYIASSKSSVKSIDFMDCFSIGAMKELQTIKNPIRRLFLKIEHKRLSKSENNNFNKFDKHFIISQPDKDALPIEDSSKVIILPNGVDFDTFYPENLVNGKEFDLLFSGHMGYTPNISAAKYAIQEIIPALSSPSKLLIAGIGVTAEISQLKSERVIVQEKFPHIREAFWKAKILLAPMNISIGLQNKILQAMAMKIPVVCTPSANLSINAPNKVAIHTATTPVQFNEAIQNLLNNDEYYHEVANQGYDFVKKNFQWELINHQFYKTLLEV